MVSCRFPFAAHGSDLVILCLTKTSNAVPDDDSMKTVCVDFPAQCLVDVLSLY